MIFNTRNSKSAQEAQNELMSLKEVLWAHTEVVKRLSDDINHMKGMITRLESAVYQNAPKQAVQEEVKAPQFDLPQQNAKRIKVETVREMYLSGMKYQDIADALNMTLQNVKNYVARYVIDRPVKSAPKKKKYVELTNVDGNTVKVPLKNEPRDEDERTILSMYVDGRKLREMCEFLNLTHGQVVGKLYRMVDPSRHPAKMVPKKSKKKRKGSQVTCPHCKKRGSTLGMYRWHFDNCKHKNK